MRIYVGTYTRGESEGIYLLEMDPATGSLTSRGLAAATDNPSFLAVHPTGKYLYAVNEVGRYKGQPSGSVSAFAVDAETGRLSPLNVVASLGAVPCHIVTDEKGEHVLIANYTGGSVAAFPIEEDGSLGASTAFHQHTGSSADPARQKGPHAHSINLDAADRFAIAADLGLDKLLVYRFDPQDGSLKENDPPAAEVEPGSGPRHFAFHPDGKRAYAINELASTVTAFTYDPETGTFETTQTISTLPEGFDGTNYTADIHVHPSGKFVYGSNRGHDSIAVFAIDEVTGKLTAVEQESTQGEVPRNFVIDPSGRFLLAANQNTDSVVVFAIDQKTGALSPTGHSVKVPAPVCLQFWEGEG
ncbi:lactonase family protein [Maioricimonas sp. JC845]|uniref:lactonase family protein n=1 Tax=Maioricimonas sp. JC845 TaxID=3232138 RepID=UPI003457ED0F